MSGTGEAQVMDCQPVVAVWKVVVGQTQMFQVEREPKEGQGEELRNIGTQETACEAAWQIAP